MDMVATQALPDILLPYQRAWLADPSPVRVFEKCRRNGVTWATALGCVLDAADPQGMSSTYTSITEEHAAEFIKDCAEWARILQMAASDVHELVYDDDGRDILTYALSFASGFTIRAFSSAPTHLRGGRKRVHRVLDEFAFQEHGEELLKAGIAARMWGGKVTIISTHNGVDSEFNKLITQIKNGERPYSLHSIDIHECVRQGLYEQIATVNGGPANGWDYTPEARKKWLDDLFAEWGDAADEELLCIPAASGSIYLPKPLVDHAAREFTATVARWKVDDKFMLRPEQFREAAFDAWWRAEVMPCLGAFKTRRFGMGWDFGRVSDLSVCALEFEDSSLVRHVPLVIELRNVPLDQQLQCVHYIWDALTICKASFDATGNGFALAEKAQQRYGETAVEAVKFSEAWYAQHWPNFKRNLQDDKLLLPNDTDIKGDLSMVRITNGVPKVLPIKNRAKNRSAGKHDTRHGDAAVALLLSDYSCPSHVSGIAYETIAPSSPFSKRKIW